MTAIIMDGKRVADLVKDEVRKEADHLRELGVATCLATVLVGEDPASRSYLKMKHKACGEVGIISKNYELSASATQDEVLGQIERLNRDNDVHGILVQLPLPNQIDSFRIIEELLPSKDVDGLAPINLGRISYKKHSIIPCTPKGIMALLNHYEIEVTGKHLVILNRSNLIGKPLYQLLTTVDPLQVLPLNTDMLLLNRDATVTVCHSKTPSLEKYTREADILITAVGKRPEFTVTANMVKEGAVVIDVGVSRVESKLYGDVDFDSVRNRAGYLTPVPGGVGPMTIAMLLHNTVIAAAGQAKSAPVHLVQRWA